MSAPMVILQGVAGVTLPATLAIPASMDRVRNRLWELRTYRGAGCMVESHFAAVFERAGIHPTATRSSAGEIAFLIPFEDLAARERAWTLLNADPQWSGVQPRFQSYQFGLYRFLEPPAV